MTFTKSVDELTMAEYIDREALIERLKFKRDTDMSKKKYSGLECAIAQIQKQPAADVVKIPCKCANCKYTEIIVCPITGTEALFCIYGTKPAAVEPTHYCGYGERKEA